jgi:hypothetical protein
MLAIGGMASLASSYYLANKFAEKVHTICLNQTRQEQVEEEDQK